MQILIISYNNFPGGDAGAVREYSLSKLFESLGHKVTIFTMGKGDSGIKNQYKGIEYYSLRVAAHSLIGKIKNYIDYSNRLSKELSSVDHKIDAILVVNIPVNALQMVKHYAKMNNCLLIHDSVEWYSPDQFKLRYFSPSFIIKELYNRVLINNQFRVIAISRYLQEHFLKRGLLVERIPIVFPTNEISYEKICCFDKLKLLYAGSPGKKDYLLEMLKGLSLLSVSNLNRIEFQIFGVSVNAIEKLLGMELFLRLKDCLVIYGKVSRLTVLENLKHTHFTVMLRNSSMRYAKAGFPTKVIESLVSATPVITNISSDLADFLIDGKNSIIVDGCSAEDFKLSVEKALKLESDEIEKMFVESRRTAVDSFDIESYTSQMANILRIL
ncbi:MAG: glycosyltransferase [Erysipelotrichaceae bacterium]|nr:glycosyltransferase [Erysipelotrichaceae bacterium]